MISLVNNFKFESLETQWESLLETQKKVDDRAGTKLRKYLRW